MFQNFVKYKFGLQISNLTFLAQADCLFAIPSKLQSWLFLLFPIIWEWRKQWKIYCLGWWRMIHPKKDMKYRKGRVVQSPIEYSVLVCTFESDPLLFLTILDLFISWHTFCSVSKKTPRPISSCIDQGLSVAFAFQWNPVL